MISGTLTNIYKKIEVAGVSGLRRTQLIKEFGKDAPKQLEELISQGLVYSGKKRNSIIYWTKDNYATNEKSSKKSKHSSDTKSKESSRAELRAHAQEDDKLNTLAADIEKKIKGIYDALNSINEKITNDKTVLINSINTKLEEVKREASMSLAKDLETINKKINTLEESIEKKADTNKILELENVLTNTLNKIDKHITDIRMISTNIQELEKSTQTLREQLNNKVDTNSLRELTESITKLEYNTDALNSKLVATNNRIDALAKEQKNNDQKIVDSIDKKISNLTNEVSTLSKSLENKADTKKVVELENSLSNNTKQLDLLNKNISSISKNVNERLDRLLRQISGKADDIKVFEMERKLESLLQVEAKLSSLENMVELLDGKIKEVREEMSKSTAIIRAELQTISNGNGNGTQGHDTLSLEQFKMEFDRTIAESSTSIGWIELAEIRTKICGKYGISKNTFYALVSQLLDTYDEVYELSSGGKEGVMVRGLIHGFIRRI